MVKKLRINESAGDRVSQVISSRVVRDKLKDIRDNIFRMGTYNMDGKDYPITNVICTIDDVYDVMGNPGIVDIIGHADIRWDLDEETDVVGVQEGISFYYDPVDDVIVDEDNINKLEGYKRSKNGRKRSVNESLSKPSVDWDSLVNNTRSGIDEKEARDFSRTYRLKKDFDLGYASEVYKWFIEDNLLADLIENQNFWVAEDGRVYIPRGTEFTFYFYPNDDGRYIYLYFLNVPELESEPEQLWDDRYYNDDSWVYEIINSSVPID